MRVSIVVPRKLPTLNELRGKYKNPHDYKRLRDGWQEDIYHLLGRRVKDLRAHKDQRKRLKVTILAERKRLADDDGNTGGAKPVFDAIVRLELAVDDHREWMDQKVEQSKGPNQCTTITLETME